MTPLEQVEKRFLAIAPVADCSLLRVVHERNERLSVRRGVVQPVALGDDLGAMVTVARDGGLGYAGTSDLTSAGLRRAAQQALEWARRTAGRSAIAGGGALREPGCGTYESTVAIPWAEVPRAEKMERLRAAAAQLEVDDRIVDWEAGLWHTEVEVVVCGTGGGRTEQRFEYLLPTLSATANRGADTQTRTFGGQAYRRQGGLEIVDQVGFADAPAQIAAQAIELLSAPNCPSAVVDLLLAPDQMIMQIHESIGHPLELDRILGDERNYAGRSFVTREMFGSYRYGSRLLDVTFDPTRPEQLGSYAFDDDGQPAERADIIRNGVLLRPLGGMISQGRAGLPGVANARASSWNRPPIDRMANLNLEPGSSSFPELVAAVERGVYMETNCSWSIDDSRNKFQFGCEWARLIEDGMLKGVVRNPNYRGLSATFWRNLKLVGGLSTYLVLGTPYCGKGEPNQMIGVGHAAPACLFADADVFGGA